MKINLGIHFGKTLKQVRKSAFLTQENLALKAGLDRSYISLLERGCRQPSLECVILLSRALNVDTISFLRQFITKFNDASLNPPPPRYVLRGEERRCP